jgi:metal-responsive CopG/Arc/MetJ family transcriptional regulator
MAEVVRFTMTLPKAHLDRLKELSAASDRSVAWLIRRAVRNLVKEHDRDPGQFTLDLKME